MSHCEECTLDPYLNLSSEQPDHDRFIKHGFFRDRSPLGWEWRSNGCLRICVSEVSQDEADDCALLQAKLCVLLDRRPPDGGPPFQPPTLYVNDAVTCTIRCSDGQTTTSTGEGTFSWTQPAGTVVALSQAEANFLASSLACTRARQHRICISSTLAGGCVNEAYRQQIRAVGGTPAMWPFHNFLPLLGCAADVVAGDRTSNFAPIPYTWSLISGSLPPGLELRPCTGYIKGTPTTVGAYSFTVRATDAIGSFQNQTLTMTIAEISTTDPLPDMVLGEDYLVNLAVDPAHDQETESWSVIAGELPPGLELSAAGVLSGIPTGEVLGYEFSVQVTFLPSGSSSYLQCTKQLHVSVGGIPDPIEFWKFEENNATRVGQIAGVELVQQFGVFVPSASGKILDAAQFTNAAFPYGDLSTDSPYEEPELRNRGTGFALVGWVNLTSSGQTPFQYFFWDAGPTQKGFVTLSNNGLSGQDADGTAFTVLSPIADGVWSFFRAWFDTDDNKMKFQVNMGTIVESASTLNFPATTAGSLDIYPESAFNPGLLMKVDEMGIWMPPLTDVQATILYNSGTGKTCCPVT